MPVRRAGKLNNLPARLDTAIRRGLIESGMVVAQTASQKAPVDTGRLMRSITYSQPKKVSKTAYSVDVGTNVIYAPALEFGSGIYAESGPKKRITPTKKKMLAFKWKNAPFPPMSPSGFYFFRSVAGVKAQPYLRPALKASRDKIKALLIKNIRAIF